VYALTLTALTGRQRLRGRRRLAAGLLLILLADCMLVNSHAFGCRQSKLTKNRTSAVTHADRVQTRGGCCRGGCSARLLGERWDRDGHTCTSAAMDVHFFDSNDMIFGGVLAGHGPV